MAAPSTQGVLATAVQQDQAEFAGNLLYATRRHLSAKVSIRYISVLIELT